MTMKYMLPILKFGSYVGARGNDLQLAEGISITPIPTKQYLLEKMKSTAGAVRSLSTMIQNIELTTQGKVESMDEVEKTLMPKLKEGDIKVAKKEPETVYRDEYDERKGSSLTI
ncbi:hypothetical protein HAX54_046500 [Datura stramonium]|uniref:Uncharacterized protein n=1 Tax=Datura stramonium TaxID=4076 RepID=A0ABS8SRX7_DATST|nr:hypothetical protein [Datura stramonium]